MFAEATLRYMVGERKRDGGDSIKIFKYVLQMPKGVDERTQDWLPATISYWLVAKAGEEVI